MASIDATAWVAPSAVVTGDVTLGPGARILHGAVVNGDRGPVAIGWIAVGDPAQLFPPDRP